MPIYCGILLCGNSYDIPLSHMFVLYANSGIMPIYYGMLLSGNPCTILLYDHYVYVYYCMLGLV